VFQELLVRQTVELGTEDLMAQVCEYLILGLFCSLIGLFSLHNIILGVF